MSDDAVQRVRHVESCLAQLPQISIATKHVLHGGLYARTITIPGGVMLTGALIKIATLLIVQGDVMVYLGEESHRLSGNNVLPASAGRKTAYLTETETTITMVFPTTAQTVEVAEKEFTDEWDRLMSHDSINEITITGE